MDKEMGEELETIIWDSTEAIVGIHSYIPYHQPVSFRILSILHCTCVTIINSGGHYLAQMCRLHDRIRIMACKSHKALCRASGIVCSSPGLLIKANCEHPSISYICRICSKHRRCSSGTACQLKSMETHRPRATSAHTL